MKSNHCSFGTTGMLKSKLHQVFTKKTFGFIIVLILSLLWPTRLIANVGFVDPNFYVGYAENFTWLDEFTKLEYHATRFPFIILVKVSYLFPMWLQTHFLKLFYLLILTYSWHKISNALRIELYPDLVLLFILLNNPIVVSMNSWTISQSFAASLSVLVASLVLSRSDYSNIYIFFLGILITTIALCNLWAGIFSILITMIVLLKKLSNTKEFSYILILILSALTALSLYELLWKIFAKQSSSVIGLNLNTIIRGNLNQVGWGEWKSEITLLSQGTIPWLAIALYLFIALSLFFKWERNNLIKNGSLEKLSIKNLEILEYTLFLGAFLSLLSHYLRINPQITSYWYFYFNLPLIFILLSRMSLINIKYRNSILSCIFLLFILTISFATSGTIPHKSFYFLVMIAAFMYLLTKVNWRYIFLSTILFGALTITIAVPSFAVAYDASSNSENLNFQSSQRELVSFLANTPRIRKQVVEWSELDSTGVLGGLESTLGYHMIRIEKFENHFEFNEVVEALAKTSRIKTLIIIKKKIDSIDYGPELHGVGFKLISSRKSKFENATFQVYERSR